MQILEQTKAMRELNNELTKTQRKDNARFHTQNNFFSKEDRDNILNRSLSNDDIVVVNSDGVSEHKPKKKRKSKNILMSTDGEEVDFSPGKMPDLRKKNRDPGPKGRNQDDELSLSDSNEPPTQRHLISDMRGTDNSKMKATSKGGGSTAEKSTTDKIEIEQRLRRVRIQDDLDDEKLDVDKVKYNQRFVKAFDNQIVFSQNDKAGKIDVPRDQRSENDVYDNVNTKPVLDLTPTNLRRQDSR